MSLNIGAEGTTAGVGCQQYPLPFVSLVLATGPHVENNDAAVIAKRLEICTE